MTIRKAFNRRPSRRQVLKMMIELGVLTVTPWGLLPTSAESRNSNRALDACGTVDGIRYPTDSLSPIHDDFGIYRAGFAGFHTGVDSQFGSYGAPVYAAANGKVTYADTHGWGTERGVVILEHVFPDGSLVYTLYGHMEEINDRPFPKVGTCVQMGDTIGSIGGPLNVAPHLHYEVRRMDGLSGGPGYTSVSPLSQGWLHPIDFTERWTLALRPFYRSSLTANQPPIQPPIALADGSYLIAEETQLERLSADNTVQWQLSVADLQGLLMLSDGELLAVTSTQVYVIRNGQFSAVWSLPTQLIPDPVGFGGGVAFVTTDQRIAAFAVDGHLLWQTAPLGDEIVGYAVSNDSAQLAVSSAQADSNQLSVIDVQGKLVFQAASPRPINVASASDGDGFFVLTSTQIGHLGRDFQWRMLLDSRQTIARGAQMIVDGEGNPILYPGYGSSIFAFSPTGNPLWTGMLPSVTPVLDGVADQSPRLAGGMCAVYALTSDGTLTAFDRHDGHLLRQAHLYAGGLHGHDLARWVRLNKNNAKTGSETIQFSAGYLSIVSLDASAFTGLENCGAD